MSLTLRTLPSLLTDCVLVGHARKADLVFTPRSVPRDLRTHAE